MEYWRPRPKEDPKAVTSPVKPRSKSPRRAVSLIAHVPVLTPMQPWSPGAATWPAAAAVAVCNSWILARIASTCDKFGVPIGEIATNFGPGRPSVSSPVASSPLCLSWCGLEECQRGCSATSDAPWATAHQEETDDDMAKRPSATSFHGKGKCALRT